MELKELIENETNKYAKRFYQLLYDENYDLIEGRYIKAKAKVTVKCDNGHIYKTTADSFNSGSRCAKCQAEKLSQERRKDPKQFELEVYHLVKDEYIFLEEYKNTHKKIKVRHNVCGHEYSVTPAHFLNGRRCPECDKLLKREKFAKTHEAFVNEVYELVKDDYSILGTYINNNTNIKIRHNICGHIYSVRPGNFLNGKRCPQCMRPNHDRDTNKYKKEVFDLTGDEYKVLEEYRGVSTPLLMYHKKCNSEHYVRPANFLRGDRCPRCKRSKGEELISQLLKDSNFAFITQKKFEGCRNKRLLPFDFAVYEDGKLLALIEYQGEQHYRSVEFWGGQEGYQYRQQNDNIKRTFCKENKIPLIEIKYSLTDKEVSDFLLFKLEQALIQNNM